MCISHAQGLCITGTPKEYNMTSSKNHIIQLHEHHKSMSCLKRNQKSVYLYFWLYRLANFSCLESFLLVVLDRLHMYTTWTSHGKAGHETREFESCPKNSSLGYQMAYSILENSIQVITFFRVDISEVNYATCRYIIDKLQTHFPSKLPTKSLFVEKNGQKLVLYYLENSKLPTKSSFVEKKWSKLVLYPENDWKSHLG